MATLRIVTGDPVNRKVDLTKVTDAGEVSFAIATGAAVKAAVVAIDHSAKYTADSTLDPSATGADWANSRVVVDIDKTETETITVFGEAYVEIQVADTDEQTWYVPAEIIQGQID